MRVTSWRKRINIFRLVFSLVKYSLLVMFGSMLVKNKRAYANRVTHAWARHMLEILAVEYKIFNPYQFEFLSDRPYIIMSNHASHFDIPLIFSTFGQDLVGMIAKKELFKIPVFGWVMRMVGCVSIDREDRYQALQDLKNAEKNMLEGVRIWIAPEGTRSRTGKLGEFKKGGFKLALNVKAIIVPVTIIGSGKILPPETFDIGVGEQVEIHIGKPIDTAHYQMQDLQKLMGVVRSEIVVKL